jgi:hypothetical protein
MKPMRLALYGALIFAACPAWAVEPIGYTAPDGVNAVAVTAATPLPVASNGAAAATTTDASGTVTLGGTYQTLQAATAARKGCTVQNPITATEALSVKVNATVYTLAPGMSLNCQAGGIVVTDQIQVTATTTAHAFSAAFQ